MNIDPNLEIDKTVIINQLLEEIYQLMAQLEQQVKEKIDSIKDS